MLKAVSKYTQSAMSHIGKGAGLNNASGGDVREELTSY